MTITTRATSLLAIEHPVVLGGMGRGATDPRLASVVCQAGGLGVVGVSRYPVERVGEVAAAVRAATRRPFGLNLLLFASDDSAIEAVLEQRPPVFSTAWPWPDQDLASVFARAHDAGSVTMHMVSTVEEARRAAAAGADLIVAQGTEGGGHVGLVSTFVLTPMVARAVDPTPVLAAGGIATGAQLAAAMMLGAEGVLLGTRFLATSEAPWPPGYKDAIVASDGHDTELTEIPDIANGLVWPGAFDRALRNRLIEQWSGREGELRRHRAEVAQAIARAAADGDAASGELNFGQAAGLIDSIEPAAEVIRTLIEDAEALLRSCPDRVT
jgi:NAD(P)H-dependent flavin oxidoreductase YrpB (nitropropane dioxygenase family)